MMTDHIPNKTDGSTAALAPGRLFELSKRVLDILAVSAAILALSPLMFLCMSWIWCRDGGPVFYQQWRVGRDGWLFRIWKFRTMRRDAEKYGAQFAGKKDPRVIPGCRWMRKSHVDELPQLFNILFGQMSIVGPRPERPEILDKLRVDLPDVEGRLAARPGLTGLAQIRNGYANDLDGMRRKLEYDLQYIRQQSLLGDIKVMIGTIPRIWDPAAC